jgi:hypothetical protein
MTGVRFQNGPRRWSTAAGVIIFGLLLLGTVFFKSYQSGYFVARPPLDLDGRPALVFFTLTRGCECQMRVVEAAEAQLEGWEVPQAEAVSLIPVNFSRRPDLARQYQVSRAPALVLLDGSGQGVWRQDLSLSDTAPLDLEAAEEQIIRLTRQSSR